MLNICLVNFVHCFRSTSSFSVCSPHPRFILHGHSKICVMKPLPLRICPYWSSLDETSMYLRIIKNVVWKPALNWKEIINVPPTKRNPGGQWRHNGINGVSNHQPHLCLLNCLFRRRSKKTPKLRVTGLCAWNSPVIGKFPAKMACNAENVSIWWRHHVYWEKIFSFGR